MIDEFQTDSWALSIRDATSILGASRSGYYRWKKSTKNGDEMSGVDDDVLKKKIESIIEEFVGYGYRRVTIELKRRGTHVNHKRVLRVMREHNLTITRKRFRPTTTDSDHDEKVYPNLLTDIEITGPNQVWAADITYIRLKEGFAYLAAILDVGTRRCIGWCLGRDLRTRIVIDALRMAIENRAGEDLTGLIHHSDRGVQYASKEYTEMLESYGIRISMSRKGNPYDNAYIESFFKTLKCEEVHLNEYRTYNDALENIVQFIEVVYNRKRMHSALGYKSPVEFEQCVHLAIARCTHPPTTRPHPLHSLPS